jgi:dipeptidyl aminopeptidase/acylaminoacyl peptidase
MERQTLQPEDLAKVRFVGEVQLSPDAAQVYYDVYYINREKNIYQGEIWQFDLKTKAERKLTAGPRRDTTPRLSPDGTKLAFLSDRGEDNKKQVFLLELDRPGEARQLSRFQSGVISLVWSPDNRYLLALVETPDDAKKAADWARPETTEARREREAREQEEKRVGGNPITFDHITLRADGRRTLLPKDAHGQLWLIDTSDSEAEPRQLTSGPFNVGQSAFSPDGNRLVFTSTRDQSQIDFSCISDLWLIEPFGGDEGLQPRKLTASKGPANGPIWSPDGTRIAFVGHTNPKDGSFMEPNRVWVIEVDKAGTASEQKCLTANFDYPVANLLNSDLRVSSESPLAWSEDGREVFFVVCHSASMQLFRVAADASAEPEALTEADRHIFSYSFAPKAGQFVFASCAPLNPGDLFLQALGKKVEAPQQLTNLNGEWLSQYYLAEPETIRVPSQDGTTEIEAWLLKPPGFDPSKKYPLVLEIHGGPHTAYGHSFYFEFQMLAGQGQVVVYPNPRGSVSYGYDFGAAIHNDWGHHDYDDIMAVVDYVIEQGYIDPERLGVTGGSYGGYMTNWIITHTDRFKVALTQRCVSNLVSMYTLSDINFNFVESEFEGDIWTNPRIWERSPIAHANKAKTPLLMLHSEADFRCPIEQAEEFYLALKRVGCPVQLVRTPNEDHNLSRNGSPDHRIGRLRRINDWFHNGLLG